MSIQSSLLWTDTKYICINMLFGAIIAENTKQYSGVGAAPPDGYLCLRRPSLRGDENHDNVILKLLTF